MRCFVLLLAVAVCQGRIPRDILKETYQPRDVLIKEQYDPLTQPRQILDVVEPQKKTLSVLEPQNKIMSVLEPVSINTPWKTWNTKLDTFQNYPVFDRKPWQQLTGRTDPFHYKNLRDLIKFPGGEFLVEEIEKYLYQDRYMNTQADLPTSFNNLEEFPEVLYIVARKLEQKLPQYMELVRDEHTLALLVTKDVVKIMLKARMQCQSTIMDKYYIKKVQEQLTQTMNENTVQLEEFLRSYLTQRMPEYPEMTNQLVYRFTKDIQQHIFTDVSQYTYGVAFKDVAVLSHTLYREVKQFLDTFWTRGQPFTFNEQTIEEMIKVVADVVRTRNTCPLQRDFTKKLQFACWDFKHMFVERTSSQIHSRVEHIFNNFWKNVNENRNSFYPLADSLKTMLNEYISTIVRRVPVCDNVCWNPLDCMQKYQQITMPTNNYFMKNMQMQNQKNVWTNIQQDRLYRN